MFRRIDFVSGWLVLGLDVCYFGLVVGMFCGGVGALVWIYG